jgi:thiol-disulfide isomerase/thioredoxin
VFIEGHAMPTRRVVCAFVAALWATGGLDTARAAGAAAPVPFDQAAFDAAAKAGHPILVEITAPWCPTCKAQAPILDRLRQDPRFQGLRTFTIDFDTQKDLVRKFGATLQSTLIAFKGKVEAARSVGETQPEWIEAQLEKTL